MLGTHLADLRELVLQLELLASHDSEVLLHLLEVLLGGLDLLFFLFVLGLQRLVGLFDIARRVVELLQFGLLIGQVLLCLGQLRLRLLECRLLYQPAQTAGLADSIADKGEPIYVRELVWIPSCPKSSALWRG